MKLHLYRHTYDPNQEFTPWLYSIARNVLNDYLRTLKNAPAHLGEDEDMDDHPGEESGNPLDRIDLKEAFSSLTPEQAEAIELTKLMGLSMEQAALRAGVSVSAMKVRAHRAFVTVKSAISRR